MAQPWDLIQPVRFGAYQLVERVATGGMAEVYLARPDAQSRFVALKRILPQIAADEDFVAMFIDEAKIAGQLNHPNVAQIFDVGKIDKSYFIAMEYVSGHDLRILWDRVRDAGDNGKPLLPMALACHIVSKICAGLDFAHRRKDSRGRPLGIIHRDVSPQNMLVSYEGDLKIIDFGVAKATGRLSKTQTGILKGKFAYMAPEQARGDLIDHRADIFAIGVILYELLTGDRAFRAETDFGLLEKVRRVDVVPPRALRPELPRELERILMKALARDVGDRYPWASALAADLDRLMSDQGWSNSREDLAAFVQRAFKGEYSEERHRLAAYHAYFDDDAVDQSSTLLRGARPPATVSVEGQAQRGGRAQSGPGEDYDVDDAETVDLVALREQARRLARGRPSLVAEGPESAEVTDEAEPAPSDPHALSRRVAAGRRDTLNNHQVGSAASAAAALGNKHPMTTGVNGSASRRIPSRDDLASVGDEDHIDHTVLDGAASLESVEPDATLPLPSASGASDPSHAPDRGAVAPQLDARDAPRVERAAPRPDPSRRAARKQTSGAREAPSRRESESAARSGRTFGAVALGGAAGIGMVAGAMLTSLMGGLWAPERHPVVFVSTPRQAEVRLGDTPLCAQTPCVATLESGRYDVLFRAPGADALSRSVEVTAKGAAPVEVVLERKIDGIRVETGPPGAHVSVDDVPLAGTTPLTLPALLAGSTVRLKFQLEGFEPLEVSRSVDSAEVWRYELPSPTTTWTILTEPPDALVDGPGRERDGRHVVTVGKRGLTLRVRRPGCIEREVALHSIGRAEAEQKVELDCRTLNSGILVNVRKRPGLKIDGVEVSPLAALDPYPMPAGTWTVVVRRPGARPESVTVELRPGEVHTLTPRVR